MDGKVQPPHMDEHFMGTEMVMFTFANSGEITIKGARKSLANVTTSISDCFTHIQNLNLSGSHGEYSICSKPGTCPATISSNLKVNFISTGLLTKPEENTKYK